MTREEYISSVKQIMINKNPYGNYHAQNFNTYETYGEMAPINSNIINDIPNSSIILSEQVYEMLLAVQYVTNETNKEVPFFLYVKEVDNNVEFNEFMSASNDRQSTQASFNQDMLSNLQKRINGNFNNGLVVCHGHSHPPIGAFNENFSLGDFTSYMQMNEENSIFKNKHVELTSCLVTSTGDINFVFYDNVSKNFYRFTNVFVKDMNNNYTPVNCYGINQREQVNNESINM